MTHRIARYTAHMVKRHRSHANETLPAADAAASQEAAETWRDHSLTFVSLVVLLLALVRCLVPFTANLYWETDPRQVMRAMNPQATLTGIPSESDVVPVLFFGPTGSAVFDVLSIAVASIALLLHVKAGGKLRVRSILAAIIGMAFCFVHARTNIEDAYLCGCWIGAISLALAALHLGERARQRRWFIAVLLALTVPLAVDAARFVFLDHAETMQMFEENEQSFLAGRGWEKDSPEHQMYLRRMSFAEPTGAFTFSNILGSIGGALALLAAGVAAGMWIRRSTWSHRWLLPASIAIIGFVIVLMTRSKGAPIALMMSLLLVALAWWSSKKTKLQNFVPIAAIALIAIAMLIVIARGMMGPPSTAEGERSLLFRWHYWQAASRIITSDASVPLIGTGPTQFSDEYHWAKNPLNPEEVRSAHNVLVDYTTMLGIGGFAISALLLAWLAQAANQATLSDTSSPSTTSADTPSLQVAGTDMAWTIAFVIALFGIDYLIRSPSYGTPQRFLIWSAGMIGCFFLIAVLTSKHWLDHIGTRLGLLGAAALLLIHAQIEMTYFQAASAPIAWMIVALAASRHRSCRAAESDVPSNTTNRFALIFPVLILLFSFVHLFTITLPVARQQSILADAEVMIRQRPVSWQTFHQTLALLEEAQNTGPFNVKPYEWQARLAMEAAASLGAQLKGVPKDKIRQQTSEEIHQLVMMALDVYHRARTQGPPSLTLLRQEAQMLLYAADMLSQPKYAQQSLTLWRELITLRPYAWSDRIELAEILWRVGNTEEATEQYRKALELSEALYLEPTRMMPSLEKQRIEKRILPSR